MSQGLTPHVTVTAGSVLPLGVLDKNLTNVGVGLKVVGSLTELVHLFAESGSPLMSYDQTDSQPLEEHPGLRASVKLAGNYAFLAPWTAQGRCEDNAGTKDTEAWR